MSDSRLIAVNIGDNEGAMFLAREAMERGTDSRVKELAEQMLADHTAILYEFQQLQAAGAGARQGEQSPQSTSKATTDAYAPISKCTRADFDSVWVANVMVMQQNKYDELTQIAETVANPQLKMAISRAVPPIRKQLAQLRSIQRYLVKMAVQRRKEAERERKSKQG